MQLSTHLLILPLLNDVSVLINIVHQICLPDPSLTTTEQAYGSAYDNSGSKTTAIASIVMVIHNRCRISDIWQGL